MAARVTIGGIDGAGLITAAVVSGNSSPVTLVATPAAGVIIRVYKLIITIAGTTTLQFQDTNSNNLSGVMNFTGNSAITLNMDGNPWYTGAAGAGINMVIGSAVQISGTVYYTATAFI